MGEDQEDWKRENEGCGHRILAMIHFPLKRQGSFFFFENGLGVAAYLIFFKGKKKETKP